MKRLSVFIAFILLSAIFSTVISASATNKINNTELVGLFGTLLVPSVFTTASADKLSASLYGRMITGEGEVPDFEAKINDPKKSIDALQIYINGRIGGLGATIGFGQGNEFQFSQPLILSIDYKVPLLKDVPIIAAAVDTQYSMMYLPDEDKMKVSALGFGAVSISGIVSANLLFLLEPYAGITLNYIYLNAKDKFYKVWKTVPKLGLKLKLLPFISVGSELTFIHNKDLNSAWLWNIGASVRF